MKIVLILVVCLVATAYAWTTEGPNQACGDTSYSDSHGVIRSPNYPENYENNLYCDYNVYPGGSMSFIFNSFHVDQSDSVTISCSNLPPHKFSGHSLPEPVSFPSCSQGKVNFVTDNAVVSSGFSIDYYVSDEGCGNTLHTGNNGYVNSPHWPDSYRYDENCSNIIWANESSTIDLFFRSFNLPSDCSRDWLEISCLDNSAYGPTRYCGNYNSYSLIIYGCSQVFLWFHSDDSSNYQGFNIEYKVYSSAITACGSTSYYGPSGVITSPNYPGNYSNFLWCDYSIHPSAGSSLFFVFESFSTQEYSDNLTITCPENTSIFWVLISGDYSARSLTYPECSLVFVQFKTDGNVVSSGFSFNYYSNVAACGNTQHDPFSGFVNSPNWPSNYGDNQDCYNVIYSWGVERTYYLTIDSFSLQNCCSCDWLEISCRSKGVLNRYCGSYPDFSRYIYDCVEVILWFHSDGSKNANGFNIEYFSYINADCGATNYDYPTGTINSPNYPYNYYQNIDCQYTINASPGSSIVIVFTSFNTEVQYDYVTISCTTNSSFAPLQFSGSSLPDPISIRWCSQGLVKFHTDSSVFDTGFSLDFYVSDEVCGDTLYIQSNGYVTSPNYPSFYGYNQDCLNIIWTPQRSTIYFYFAQFQLPIDCAADKLTITCIDSTIGGSAFCGNYDLYSFYYYGCSQVLLEFHSDGSNNDQGFNIEYTINPATNASKAVNDEDGSVPSNRRPIAVDNPASERKLKAAETALSNRKLEAAEHVPKNGKPKA